MKVFSSFVLLLTVATAVAGESPPVETHQILYLADSGVFVLQMSVLVDGQGPRQRFELFVDALLKSLDKNGDGDVTVEEARGKILSAREAQQMQLVSSEAAPADSSPDTSPRDGKISRAELLAYFKRIGLLPFAVKFQPRTNPADQVPGAMPAATGEVPLFAKLDVNGDKKLSVEELQNALEVLHKLDRDDDETISIAELQPLANQPRAANRRGMNNNPPPAAIPFISLASGESLPRLIRRLVDKYDSTDAAKSGVPSLSTRNQKLSRTELGLPEANFTEYDVDGDGQLDFTELRQFVSSREPDLELVLDLTSGKVSIADSHGRDVRNMSDGSVNIPMGSAQIGVSAVPASAVIDPEAMIRPFFMAVDADANGYLEKSEAPDNALLGASFADLDDDKNGKLYLTEIVDYMKPRLDLVQHRVELLIVEQGRTLFDILDSDRDGRLAHREVRSVADKLALWDSNGDGYLSESEIPLQFQMVASQGALPVFGLPQPVVAGNRQGAVATRTAGPAWFTRMDRNRDGEVSRREFLGDLDLFEKLDLNHDGAIELTEAVQVKAN